MEQLKAFIGKTDIYLVDLLLSIDLPPKAKIFDAGCGSGRNLETFLACDYEVFAQDRDPLALQKTRERVLASGKLCDDGHYKLGSIESLSFADDCFDLVICNAVLHFAADEAEFCKIVTELWRVLAPGAILFCRLASDIGIEDQVEFTTRGEQSRWRKLPDGSERFLVDLGFLKHQQENLGAQQMGRIKTVNVEGLRCMTNWVLKKPA